MKKNTLNQQLSKIASVPYLNARPLIQGISNEIQYDIPSNLVKKILNNDLIAALIPVFDYFKYYQEKWKIINGIGICTNKCVDSVYLTHKRTSELKQIKNIYLHNESSTSASLLKIILKKQFSIDPQYKIIKNNYINSKNIHELNNSSAVLIIGDKAIKFKQANQNYIFHDLGKCWSEMTNLPFVFAFWVINSEDINTTREISNLLKNVKKKNSHNHEKIIEIAQEQNILSPDQAIYYLTKNLHYDLKSKEKKAIKIFQKYCLEYNLITQESNAKIKYNWI